MDIESEVERENQKDMYHIILEGDWSTFLDMYEKNPQRFDPSTKMTKSGDTVLHVAAVHGAEDFVTKLFDEIKSKTNNEEYLRILSAKNERGQTPLHYAASWGSLDMCKSILSDGYFYSLAHLRNRQGETPLFLAALHGHKETFLYLHWVNITSLWVKPMEKDR